MIDTKQLIKAGEEKMTFAIEYLVRLIRKSSIV